jgi:cyclase
MDPTHTDAVAELFARSDAGELPMLAGVRRRTLLTFHDLYFHLIEADAPVRDRVARLRDHPEFRDIDRRLAEYISPYHHSWREPADAMAVPFYSWSA